MVINGRVFDWEEIDWNAVRNAYKEYLVQIDPLLKATDKYIDME